MKAIAAIANPSKNTKRYFIFQGMWSIYLNLLVLSDNVKTSLVAKIAVAEAQATKDNVCVGVNILSAFGSQIEAQRNKKVSDEAADLLVGYADNVISKLISQLPEGESC